MDEIYLVVICTLFFLIIKLTDSKPNKVKYYLKWYTYYFYSLMLTIILSSLLIWRGRDINNLPTAMRWLQPMTKFHGVTWHLENAEVLKKCSGRAVIISNHQSSLDLLGMFHVTPTINVWIPIAKKEFMYMGPVGLLAYLVGTIFVNRRNPKEAYTELNNAMDMMKKNEMKTWIFPEGTRNKFKKVKLLPFKKGAFSMAVATQSPIIPIVFSPYYFARETEPVFENGGHVILRCLEPVSTAGLTEADVPALSQRFHAIILDAYEQLTKEVQHRFPGASLLPSVE